MFFNFSFIRYDFNSQFHVQTSTGESFLAGLSSCAVTLVQAVAATEGVALGPLSVEVSSHRTPDKPYDYDHIDVAFTYEGLPLGQAERLTELWKER